MSTEARGSRILSAVVAGSGVEVIHRILAEQIDHYELHTISPTAALLGPLFPRPGDREAALVHTLPDLGGWLQGPGLPSVITFHNFYLDDFALANASWGQRAFYRGLLKHYIARAVRRATVVTAVSRFTAGLVRHHLDVGVEVIANGVDCDRFRPAESPGDGGRLRVLFVGNPSRRKGRDLLERLAMELADDCRFLCTGGLRGARTDSLPASVVELGRIPYSRMPDLYRQADVLLLPTRREGMSLATLEAMASGLAVVTTDLSSQPELIENGRGGYTLAIDDLKGFAACLRTLARDRPLCREMGMFNRERALTEYPLANMVQAYRQLFSHLLSSG